MGQLGVPELLLIGAIALLLFGPARLPEVGRSLGRAMREFRNAVRSMSDDEDEGRPAKREPGGETPAGEEGRRQPAG
ncbi:MAG TPA: twin-arginine translocase TatA/TatE family subunit [Thermaerobacter sp.]